MFEDSNNIYYLQDYEPYRVQGEINPYFNKSTGGYLLDFKEGKLFAIERYFNLLKQELELISDEKFYVTCVPSSRTGEVGDGLSELINLLCKEYSWINICGCLHRDYNINKLATGGERSKDIHKKSISLLNPERVKGRTILLIDDITTTGNSLITCRDILFENGVEGVLTIALGKTIEHYGEAWN